MLLRIQNTNIDCQGSEPSSISEPCDSAEWSYPLSDSVFLSVEDDDDGNCLIIEFW